LNAFDTVFEFASAAGSSYEGGCFVSLSQQFIPSNDNGSVSTTNLEVQLFVPLDPNPEFWKPGATIGAGEVYRGAGGTGPP